MEAEAVGHGEVLAGAKAGHDFLEDLGGQLVGDQRHDDVAPIGRLGHVFDREARRRLPYPKKRCRCGDRPRR